MVKIKDLRLKNVAFHQEKKGYKGILKQCQIPVPLIQNITIQKCLKNKEEKPKYYLMWQEKFSDVENNLKIITKDVWLVSVLSKCLGIQSSASSHACKKSVYFLKTFC